jgi:hypothetical protein
MHPHRGSAFEQDRLSRPTRVNLAPKDKDAALRHAEFLIAGQHLPVEEDLLSQDTEQPWGDSQVLISSA